MQTTRQGSSKDATPRPLLWLGGRGLPVGRLGRELKALGVPVWHEPLGPGASKRILEIDPLLVLVEAADAGSLLKKTLQAVDRMKYHLIPPVFVLVEPNELPPVVRADGCFVKARGLGRQLQGVLAALRGWQALRFERRRKLARLARLKRDNQRLRTLVVRDDLTQLYNLRFFTRSLESEHARATRFGRQYSVAFIDVDDLKGVNSRFGHLAGSRVLKSLGEYLSTRIRHIDVAARIGGDEFVVICPETAGASARILCERIRIDLDSLVLEEQGVSFRIAASFGVASFPEDGDFPEQIVERADRALFVAKSKGKNRVCCWGDFPTGHGDVARGTLHASRLRTKTRTNAFAPVGPLGAVGGERRDPVEPVEPIEKD